MKRVFFIGNILCMLGFFFSLKAQPISDVVDKKKDSLGVAFQLQHQTRFQQRPNQSLIEISPIDRSRIKNFPPHSYGTPEPVNRAIIQDNQGVFYVANRLCILTSNGISWGGVGSSLVNPYVLPSVSTLATDKNGRIYLAGEGDFGYLSRDSIIWKDNNNYVSLLEQLAPENKDFGTIKQIISSREGIYFCASNHLFLWANDSLQQWHFDSDIRLFQINDFVYIWKRGIGLGIWNQGKMELIPNGSDLAELSVLSLLAFDENSFLITTKEAGFFLYRNNTFQVFETAVDAFLRKHLITKIIKISSTNYAIGTQSGGLVIINSKGQLDKIIDKEKGILANNILDVYLDNRRNIWLALDNGISYITHQNFQSYSTPEGLSGYITSICEHQQKLYVATKTGVFVKPLPIIASRSKHTSKNQNNTETKSDFSKIKNLETAITGMFSVGKSLFIASKDGVFVIENQQVRQITTESSTTLWHSKIDSNLVYVGTEQGLAILKRQASRWKYDGKIKGISGSIKLAVEDKKGWLWLGMHTEGLFQVNIHQEKPQIIHHKFLDGKLDKSWVNVLPFKGEAVIEQYPYFVFDYSAKQFIEHPFIKETETGSYPLRNYAGQLYPYFFREDGFVAFLNSVGDTLRQANGNIWWSPEVWETAVFNSEAFYYTNDGTLWIGTPNGLRTYNNVEPFFSTPFKAKIESVSLPMHQQNFDGYTDIDSLIFGGSAFRPENFQLKIPFKQNSLTIRFGLNQICDNCKFVGKLIRDQKISKFNPPSNFTSFYDLPEGEYKIEVYALRNWQKSLSDSFSFRILPPWYKTWWAYSFYIFFLSLGSYFFYKFLLNKALDKAEAQRLKDLDTLKTKLYTNLTHEFRTPLTVILGMADQIKNQPNEWLSKGIYLIKKNGQQLLYLINQLLDLSKLESGKMELNMIQGDIIPFLKYNLESFHSLAESKAVKLHFLSDTDALLMDYDPQKITSIISNLLSNAIKFTPSGGDVYLQLQASITKEDKSLFLKVKDTGIGISEENLQHVFDRFYQVDETHKKVGSGVGLSIIYQLVHLFGGDIQVASQLGKGTEFTLKLIITNKAKLIENPIDSSFVKDQMNQFELEENNTDLNLMPTAEEDSIDKPLILIIEDNQDVVAYLQACLIKDYHIQVAYNGSEGIKKALELVPDLIISDVMMPIKDGFEVCDHLKQDSRTSHIPIILLTAKADMAARIKGLKRGADAYLSKPFNKEELFVEIEKLIALRQQLKKRFGGFNYLNLPKDRSFLIEDAFLKKLVKTIDNNISNPDFKLPHFQRAMGLSRSQFFKKLKLLTSQSPSLFIRSHRLHRAQELLKKTELSISDVAYEVGFSEVSTFSRYYKETFGIPPSETRN